MARYIDAQHWIPCSERLPEEYTKAIVQAEDGVMTIGTYTKYGWIFPCHVATSVAWMPLPPSYQGE